MGTDLETSGGRGVGPSGTRLTESSRYREGVSTPVGVALFVVPTVDAHSLLTTHYDYHITVWLHTISTFYWVFLLKILFYLFFGGIL